jgi:pentafunctional AROM polypeptide
LKVEGVELNSLSSAGSINATFPTSSASIVICGMRGSGKTSIGEIAASCLDWPFVDADALFEEKHQQVVREFVHKNGWQAFRAAETDLLRHMLSEYSTKHVISLGGGIVETPEARELLQQYAKAGPVVHMVRDLDEIVEYLGIETARPAYGESVEDVYHRRAPWFVQCCTHEFVNNTRVGESTVGLNDASTPVKMNGIREEVNRFFHHVTGKQANLATNLTRGKRSYFLSLTYPDVTQALPIIEELTTGVDAIELRVDLLRDPGSWGKVGPYIPKKSYVVNQIRALRRATSLPIVFTVRTVSQGGSFPDTSEKVAFEFFHLAIRMGVEYIDLEITWSQKRIGELAKEKGHSQIIASWHDWSGNMKWDGPDVKSKYEQAVKFGDIIKIVGKANVLEDNFALYKFVSQTTSSPSSKPIIAINMGVEGQMSRILNPTLSPVTHPLLPNKAAPGQLSFMQIQTALHLVGQLPAQRYFLFGNPISHSMSPTLHNTGFKALGLPHVYELLETTEVGEEIKANIAASDFGGASVTIPFKLDIIPLLDALSPEAEVIGAVNTVVPVIKEDGSRILLGDNTDWRGIRECIRSRLPTQISKPEAGLIIGAGGTSRAAIYALNAIGVKEIYLFNRTKSSGQALVAAFPEANLKLIGALGTWPGPPPTVIVSTVPASATTNDTGASGAMVLPPSIFEAHDGVVVDMAYKPAETPLLILAEKVGKGWKRVRGLEVLLEQGYAQFEMWTGRRCPRRIVEETVWKNYSS